MTATIKPSDARKLFVNPEDEATFFGDKGRWALTVNGERQAKGSDWEAASPFGSVSEAVVLGGDGKPLFTRPIYREAPNVNCVVWGIGNDGKARFAVISQPRPHADDPEHRDEHGHKPIVFGQVVMGFLERIIGKDLVERHEAIAQGAAREASEEAGVAVVKNITYPACPWHNPNPTFVATWSDLAFVEVDLNVINALKDDRNEPIFSAEYITAEELRRRVAQGKDENGSLYRMCTANSVWFIFFCTHPELFMG